MDIAVPATVITAPWGSIGGTPVGGNSSEVTVTLHIDTNIQDNLQQLLGLQPAAPPATLSAQDLANLYSSSELIAAYQLAVKAGR